ncbi:MAG: hypothetical protein IRZ16_23790 [Myxococcaceae bacterium]|nr:hypothetical protein [Myxococcaceae bacterium]
MGGNGAANSGYSNEQATGGAGGPGGKGGEGGRGGDGAGGPTVAMFCAADGSGHVKGPWPESHLPGGDGGVAGPSTNAHDCQP